ncbi:MAG: cation transporter [Anaerolineaceae bacterium]|nr:MAG: cation transporter [Anaerolineaceae bacterium]
MSDNRYRDVRRVFVVTLALNLCIAFGKIALGMATGALAITADGLHSLTDGASNITGIIASTIAARPPDADHHYGHRRYELLAALLIAGFLFLLAWEVITGALGRIGGDSVPSLTPLTFVVLTLTLTVNIGVAWYQRREGRRLRSTLLLADAEHTRADALVTVAVIVSMGVIALTGWGWVDVAAALVVVALIARAAWGIIAQTGRVLVDAAPYSAEQLIALVEALPAVQSVARARSRGLPDSAHVDIDVRVSPQMTAAQTATIADCIRAHLREQLTGIGEVEVHFIPHESNGQTMEDVALAVRSTADAHGLMTHDVTLNVANGRQVLDLHVEVPPAHTLEQAHAAVTALEDDLVERLPDLSEVITHIEPSAGGTVAVARLDDARRRIEERAVLDLLTVHYPAVDWHHLRLYRATCGGLKLTLHAALKPSLTVVQAHQLADDAETLIRTHRPHIKRITIHTEPQD